ncbi:amino acid ABC transporter permease [Paraburkholderia phenoliruptrix]|uniref:Glutamate/aspartate import permease protein GltK n=2 Tax=Paraburkholderia phenoliruptrix TaxID=252970 RepID=K0DWF0_9BURK|nr:amino acid ABC transporter permease [Paraburkholderia phenoliruptrix]AFT90496.1 ABC polar amino acid transporter, inner membrane subunit [Paraburkholderia phenoliruptrix BR3459a]CAB4051908.1 L-cystine transport system permease protein YecS [Paraburkholderia phenoliruptrix]
MLTNIHVVFDPSFFLKFVFSPSPALLKGLVATVVAAAIAQFLGTVIGFVLAIAGMAPNRIFRGGNQVYIWFFRGTPVLVQLVLIYFGLPYLVGFDLFPAVMHIGPFEISGALVAGIMAFGMHEGAYMSEITRASITAIPRGQWEAAQAIGMTPGMTMHRIIMPQALPLLVPALGNQFNNMLKTTSLLSVIGVAEMFRVAEQLQAATFMTFEVYLGVSVYYLALTGLWTLAQHFIEKRLSRHLRSRRRRETSVGKNPHPEAAS